MNYGEIGHGQASADSLLWWYRDRLEKCPALSESGTPIKHAEACGYAGLQAYGRIDKSRQAISIVAVNSPSRMLIEEISKILTDKFPEFTIHVYCVSFP